MKSKTLKDKALEDQTLKWLLENQQIFFLFGFFFLFLLFLLLWDQRLSITKEKENFCDYGIFFFNSFGPNVHLIRI